MAAKRSYGSGRVYVRTDAGGRESFYGSWWANGRRVNRLLGVKRLRGSREGLTGTQAEERLRELIADTVPAAALGDRLTLSEAGRRYQAHLEKEGRKRATLVAVESTFRVWLDPHLGEKALDVITTADVEDLMRTMEGEDVGPKSIRNYIGTLSALYKFGMHGKRKWASANPCEDVDLPKRKRSEEIHYLMVVEVEALASAVEGDYQDLDRALYLTAAMTGLRQGELLALRWQDVDWSAQRVRVRRSHVLGEFDTPKSRRGSRSVPMNGRVVGELDRWHQVTAGTAMGISCSPSPPRGTCCSAGRSCAVTGER